MSDYYILKSDQRLSNAIEIKGANNAVNIDYIKTNQLQFIDSNPVMFHIEDNGLHPDFIETPLPLISNEFWIVFEELKLKNIFFKPVCLADIEKMTALIYWLIIPDKIDCLSNATEFNRDGSLKTLVINKEKVGFYKIFKVNGILEDFIIVDGDIVDAIDTNTYGCTFTKI